MDTDLPLRIVLEEPPAAVDFGIQKRFDVKCTGRCWESKNAPGCWE